MSPPTVLRRFRFDSLIRSVLAVCLLTVATWAAHADGTKAAAALQPGIDLFEAGDNAAAEVFFREQLQARPGNAWAAYYLARARFSQEDADGAIEWFGKATELNPAVSDFHLWLGRAYLDKLQRASMFKKLGLSKKVRASYLEAIELDPDNLGARESLAGYYFEAPSIAGGSEAKGLEQVAAIRARDPRRAHVFLGSHYLEKERFELAEKEYRAALAIDPEKPETHYRLGRLYQDTERYPDAFAAFEKAVELDADHMASVYQIGRTAALSGKNLDRGIECLQSYLEHRPSRNLPSLDWAHWRLGLIYEHKGDTSKARQAYEAALRIDPKNEEAKKALKKL